MTKPSASRPSTRKKRKTTTNDSTDSRPPETLGGLLRPAGAGFGAVAVLVMVVAPPPVRWKPGTLPPCQTDRALGRRGARPSARASGGGAGTRGLAGDLGRGPATGFGDRARVRARAVGRANRCGTTSSRV